MLGRRRSLSLDSPANAVKVTQGFATFYDMGKLTTSRIIKCLGVSIRMHPDHKQMTWAGASKMQSALLFLVTFMYHVTPTPAPSQTPPSNHVNIAVLLPRMTARRFAIERVQPAISMALANLEAREAINAAFNFYLRRRVHVFLGPCCDYAAAPVARQIRYWNLPMLTAGAMAGDFGTSKKDHYPLLTRVGPDFNSLAKFLLQMLDHYNFRRVKLIYNPFGQTDIVEKFCHLAADSLHRTMMRRGKNLTQDYYKFINVGDMQRKLTTEIGNTFSSGRYYGSRHSLEGGVMDGILLHYSPTCRTCVSGQSMYCVGSGGWRQDTDPVSPR
ncbi:hypothetical protein NP493_512g00005 [Ridgeia piscesae]|uniref:Receptor ligand binding region domain-containing protein n=1 Tax=Ridgeia piscesae TaxID=27915 RepID=A0AAD9KY99_RIDPI|nr:hypothetical protein NP493_512g00005 [Ridgeia piscesae]